MKKWVIDGGGGIGNWWLFCALRSGFLRGLGIQPCMRTSPEKAALWRQGRLKKLPWVNFGEAHVPEDDAVPSIEGVEFYETLEQALADSAVELVIGCTPRVHHKQRGLLVLNSKCHYLCEKPLAATVPDAEEMLEAARSNQRVLMAGQVVPRMAEFGYLNDVAAKGSFGRLDSAVLRRTVHLSDPCANGKEFEVRGDAMDDLTEHDFHQAVLLGGGLPTAVYARGDVVGDGFVRSVVADLFFGEKNSTVRIISGATDRPDFNFGQGFDAVFRDDSVLTRVTYDMSVIGGQFRLDQPLSVVSVFERHASEIPTDLPPAGEFDWFQSQLRHAREVIYDGAELGAFDPTAAMQALIVSDAVRAAIKSRKLETRVHA